ncbi:MAG: MarR family winged helix-turn-helix transcriptional regulator [Ilumatobacteraceae bacterium]
MGAVTDGEKPVPMARLLAMAYRLLIDELHSRLPAKGWTDVRPSYGFVLLAARGRSTSTVELARLLGVSKQAASKLVGAMEEAGYLRRSAAERDGRMHSIELADRGEQLLVAVEGIYAELEAGWSSVIGDKEVERLRRDLSTVLRAANDGQLPKVRPAP